MLDFGALPPEINSARMYAGPGSGPMMAAASAWDALAAELDLFATGYSGVISGLQGNNWSGAASEAMASAAAPYVAWLTTAAAQAEHSASAARAAAGAYEVAFAATVPPPVVAANRIQLATLVATNFFGQNTPAIAATEAAYAEMWAQDAAAMYGYAASSLAAATLPPFSEPPQTTNAAGQPVQAAAVAHAASGSATGHVQTTLSGLMSSLSQQLQTLSTAGSSSGSSSPGSSVLGSSPILTAFDDLNTLTGPLSTASNMSMTVTMAGSFGTALRLGEIQGAAAGAGVKLAPPAVSAGRAMQGTSLPGEVFASVNSTDQVGRLSVPQSWTAATPPVSPAAESLPSTGFRALPAWAANPPASMPGVAPPGAVGPTANIGGRRGGNAVFRMRDRRFRMPRPSLGG